MRLLARRPPTTFARSSTRTGMPASVNSRAQARPAMPAPTTITVTRRTVREGTLGPMPWRPPIRVVAVILVVVLAAGALGAGLWRAATYEPPAVTSAG